MIDKLSDDVAFSALKNLVEGATVEEKIEEYIVDKENKMVLKGTKKTTKKLPPDLNAIRTVLSLDNQSDLDKLSDKELEEVKQKLFKQLLEEENNKTNENK